MNSMILLGGAAATLLAVSGAALADPPPAASPWGDTAAPNAQPSVQFNSPSKKPPVSASDAARQSLKETGSAGNVPGGGPQGPHMNNGGMEGNSYSWKEFKNDAYNASGGWVGEKSNDSTGSKRGDDFKNGYGNGGAPDAGSADAGSRIKDFTPPKPKDPDESMAADMGGSSGGGSKNGNGKTVNLGSKGGQDGGKSDQGGNGGTAVANATGQTLNPGNKGGGDGAPKAPVTGEQLNAGKLINGAVDPKRDGPGG